MKWFRLIAVASMVCSLLGVFWAGFFFPARAHAKGDTITIHITGVTHPSGFLPALASVHVNDTVVFINDAEPAATYTVVAADQSFTSPPLASGQQWSTTFTTPGFHNYTDPAHSAQMFGAVVVQPASVPLLSTPAPAAVQTAIAQDKEQLANATKPSPSPQASSLPLSMILGGVGGLLLILGIASFFVIRSKRRQKALPPVK